jgi:hypothetical protein
LHAEDAAHCSSVDRGFDVVGDGAASGPAERPSATGRSAAGEVAGWRASGTRASTTSIAGLDDGAEAQPSSATLTTKATRRTPRTPRARISPGSSNGIRCGSRARRVRTAAVGAMALNEYGYERVTKGEGLAQFKSLFLGRGYVEKFEGSKGLRDTTNNVVIDVLIAGDYPGDRKAKPVAFPDPAEVAVRGSRVALVPLAKLVELKLASGMTAPHRLKDLADILELVRAAHLPAELGDALDPYVRAKFRELWDAAQGGGDEE